MTKSLSIALVLLVSTLFAGGCAVTGDDVSVGIGQLEDQELVITQTRFGDEISIEVVYSSELDFYRHEYTLVPDLEPPILLMADLGALDSELLASVEPIDVSEDAASVPQEWQAILDAARFEHGLFDGCEPTEALAECLRRNSR